MNQNYEQMSFSELRAYVVENREDIEARARFNNIAQNPVAMT